MTLLCPLREEASPEVLTAAKRLTKRWRDDTVIGPFISQLADGGPTNQPLLQIMNRRELRPFDIVWAAATADDAQVEQVLRREFNRWYHEMKQASDVARELRHALRRLANDEARDALSRFIASTKVIGNTSPRERWLRHFPADRTAPAKWVNELADRVGASANDVAAPIVAAAGELELAVLEPSHWLAADRRLEPRLYQAHRDKPTPLVELGLGLRAWCEWRSSKLRRCNRILLFPSLSASAVTSSASREKGSRIRMIPRTFPSASPPSGRGLGY